MSTGTHFSRNKNDLLGRVISAELDDRRRQITDLVASAEDPFWAVVSWSVEADPDGVWPALVSATAAGVAPAIGQLVRDFDARWTDLIIRLVVCPSPPTRPNPDRASPQSVSPPEPSPSSPGAPGEFRRDVTAA